MSSTRVKLISSGIQELMKSEEVIGELQRHADNIVKKCAKGSYATSQYVGKSRANVSIYTTDRATYFRNLHTNELMKNLKG